MSEVTQGTFVPSLVNVGSELGSEVNTAVVLVQVSSLGEGFSVGTQATGVLHDILLDVQEVQFCSQKLNYIQLGKYQLVFSLYI